MMMNVSGEQSIDSALNMTTDGASNGFRFSKWIFKMGWRGTKFGWSHHKGAKHKQLEMMSDACSAYRGGCIRKSSKAELADLLNDLSGRDVARIGGNFLFLGDRTDLSLFWKREKTTRTPLSR